MAIAPATSHQLRDQTAALAEIAASPELHAALAKIAAAPPSKRLGVAEQVATVDALRKAGVKVPSDLRITTRYFENTDALTRGDVLLDPPATTPAAAQPRRASGGTLCVSIGEIVCVTYGRELLTAAQ